MSNQVFSYGGRKKERDIGYEVVAWCIDKMMPRMRSLSIDVHFTNINSLGYCSEEDTKSREFTIAIQKGQTVKEMISTIIHEMIHVKQYARKELRHVEGKTMWKKSDHTDTEYHKSPWEHEAYLLETQYVEEYMSERG